MTPSGLSPIEEQSMQAFRAGRFAEAAAGFESARREYEAAGDSVKQAEMANNQSVALLQGGQARAALAAVQGTPEALTTLGDVHRAALAYGNLGAALAACGELVAAEAAYHQAADRFERLGDMENASLTLKALSQLQLRRGRPLSAMTSMQAGLGQGSHLGPRQRLLNWLLSLPYKLLGR